MTGGVVGKGFARSSHTWSRIIYNKHMMFDGVYL